MNYKHFHTVSVHNRYGDFIYSFDDVTSFKDANLVIDTITELGDAAAHGWIVTHAVLNDSGYRIFQTIDYAQTPTGRVVN